MSALTGRKRVEAFVELPAPKWVRGAGGEIESPTPLEEGAASRPFGPDTEGSGSQLMAPEGSVDGKVGSPEAWVASLGPDPMGAGEAMEETLGNTTDGPEHERTGADELVEETLGGTKVVLGKFGLVRSRAIFAGPETGQSGPRRNFWDQDRDCQGPSRSVWSRSRPGPDGPWW